MNANHKVLLVGWDAADWKVIHPLMDAGKMPNVKRLVDQGVMGQIATLQPALSPMLWTSIATGKRPFKHGIHGFAEPSPDGLGVQPVTNLSRRCKAVWNILNQNGARSIVIGWWPSHPAEPIRGVAVSNHYHRARGPLENGWPMLPHTVHPPELADTLAALRMHPSEVLGPMLQAFVPRAAEVDQNKDRRLVGLAQTLCECVSMHSAATWLIENQPWDFFAIYYDAIDHFSHGFMRYYPPRQEHISEQDFELYQGVVSTAYQFHDQMLGRLLQDINENVTIILMSDHGFHPDHLRPRAIPPVPAGPAVEHRDFGVLAMKGPGIKRDELLHGASVLDIAPTLLTLFGLPVGADMDGKVLVGAFEDARSVETIPSWEEVPGDDGRHPPHTLLDPVSAKESLEQLAALGYIAKPDENQQKAVADTIQELRYNLAVAYQDADRHAEAAGILRELRRTDPDEQRFAVHLFLSCQSMDQLAEMREIVEDLDGRRLRLFQEAKAHLKEFAELIHQRREAGKALAGQAPTWQGAAREKEEGGPDQGVTDAALAMDAGPLNQPELLLSDVERTELEHWRKLARFEPPVVDFLRAQVLASGRLYGEAIKSLQQVQGAQVARSGLYLQTGELYLKMEHWEEAKQAYMQALDIDPDNPHAHLGMCRMAFQRRDFTAAAQSALEAIQRLHHYPMAHYLLGVALVRLKEYSRAAEAFRAALSLNPNFEQAHLRLAVLFERRLNDPEGAAEHRNIYRELRLRDKRRTVDLAAIEPADPANAVSSYESSRTTAGDGDRLILPELGEPVVVVSGLPRAGTSMIMQMVAAGGLPLLTDGLRDADADNPRGYLEFEAVKELHKSADWLKDARGKAVKIVAPLLAYLPNGIGYRVILIERNLDEILESQGQMLTRRGESISDTPARRARLKEEYTRLLEKMKTFLLNRPDTQAIFLRRDDVLRDPLGAASDINRFLGGNLAVNSMADAVDPKLHRQRHVIPEG